MTNTEDTTGFELVEESELIPTSLNSSPEENSCSDYISFKDAMNTIYQEYPSFDKMLKVRNNAAQKGEFISVNLVDCAICTQLWLKVKSESSAAENQDAISALEAKMIKFWRDFRGE
jgi:hypothetical protein